jgi:hypothetical protein
MAADQCNALISSFTILSYSGVSIPYLFFTSSNTIQPKYTFLQVIVSSKKETTSDFPVPHIHTTATINDIGKIS